MQHHHLFAKELEETATSSFASSGFEYRSRETAIDFGLLRQTQKERITHLCQRNSKITQDQLLEQFERIEEESNQFIQSLLEQLAISCRRQRKLQMDHQNELRDQNIHARKLTEDNIRLASVLQAERYERQQESTRNDQRLRDSQQLCNSLWKEGEGMKRLMGEYEKELQSNHQKIDQLTAHQSQANESIKIMLKQIEEQKQEITQYQSRLHNIQQQKAGLVQELRAAQDTNNKLIENQKELQELRFAYQAISQQLHQMQGEQRRSDKMIQHLELKLLQANGQMARNQIECDRAKSAAKDEKSRIISKEEQWKETMQRLELKAKRAVEGIIEKYESKIKKLRNFYQRQIKLLKNSFKTTKQEVSKQMLLCYKLIEGDFKERLRTQLKTFSKN